jgi:hypothetical protein
MSMGHEMKNASFVMAMFMGTSDMVTAILSLVFQHLCLTWQGNSSNDWAS